MQTTPNGVMEMHTPFGGFATTFAPVGSVSLDSQSPKGSLRIQFPCHPAKAGALWVLSTVPHDIKGKRRAVYSAP